MRHIYELTPGIITFVVAHTAACFLLGYLAGLVHWKVSEFRKFLKSKKVYRL